MEVNKDEMMLIINIADWAIMNGYEMNSEMSDLFQKLIKNVDLENDLQEYFQERYGFEFNNY